MDLSIDVYKRQILKPSFVPKTFALAPSKTAKPRVFIPVFPGTNCEYDSARAFELAGASASTLVFTMCISDRHC